MGLLDRLTAEPKQQPTAEDTANEIAVELALANQLAQPIIEAVAGYRAKCIEAGFDDAAAQQMSVDYHAGLLKLMLR